MAKYKKRADGRYQANIYIGKDETGKQKYRTVYGKTVKEVDQKAAELRYHLSRGINMLSGQTTFQEWAERYLATEKDHLTQQNLSMKRAHLNYFAQFIGRIPLSTINAYDIDPIIAELAKKNPNTGKPSSAKTLRAYLDDCSQVFRYAIQNRSVAFNPCDYVKLPAAPSKKRRALSAEERGWILECTCYARLPAITAIYAGLRRGEMTALKWSDIDMSNRVITVRESFNFKTSQLKKPKTEAGLRKIPIVDVLFQTLSAIPKESRKGYVFQINGKMLTEGWWRSLICDLLVEIDRKHGSSNKTIHNIAGKHTLYLTIEPFDWHSLRHTYATLLYDAGVDVLTAKELLGHTDVKTTMGIYTHLSKERKSISVDKLNRFIADQVKNGPDSD